MINLKKQDPIADAVKGILQQEALKGNQGAIDKNHNNKVDAEDFEILRGEKKAKKKEVAEETVEEGIKEIAKKAFKALTGGSDEDQLKDLQRKMNLPQTGKKPSDKAMGEEVEQIDELSKSTLGSYVKNAAKDVGASRSLGANFANNANKSRKPSSKSANSRLSDRFNSIAQKRHAGIDKAVERLTKEEIMPKTLKQFKENAFDWKKKPDPEPNGGSGVKQGSRYGGSKQKDVPEKDTDEKK
jgi:hypothetical protein